MKVVCYLLCKNFYRYILQRIHRCVHPLIIFVMSYKIMFIITKVFHKISYLLFTILLKFLTFSNVIVCLNFSVSTSPLCDIINVFVSPSRVLVVSLKTLLFHLRLKNYQILHLILSRLVFTEFFNFATALHVNNSARSILIFSPSLKFAYENASRYLDLIDSLNPSSSSN